MKITAYCTLLAVRAVQAATGVKPFTSPPWTANQAGSLFRGGADLYYFRLHGQRGAPGLWFGERRDGGLIPALDLREGIKGAGVIGAVIVIANCYAFDDQYLQEFYKAGAMTVIAGAGKNWAAKGSRVVGTDLLVQWIIRGLRMDLSPRGALWLARSRLMLTRYRLSDRDAAEFQIVEDKTK